ncbi:MAG: glycosyltransferase family 4 protein [Pseudomonadota bacterium]
MRILLTANTAFALTNFRLGLIRALRADGHEVFVLVPDDAGVARLVDEGCQFRPLSMNRRGTHVFEETMTVLNLMKVFREVRPDAVLGYTIKNNLYGAFAARMYGIPFIPNVTGLGKAFAQDGVTKRVALWAYRAAFFKCPKVFFQNRYDMEVMLSNGQVLPDQAAVLPGSGVNLGQFQITELPGHQAAPTFLFIGRLLWDKGVGEFVDAAKQLKVDYPQAQFQLLGDFEVEGTDAVPKATVEAWHRSGIVDYLGRVDDVRTVISQSDCVVLPTYYREGTPRSLLEAAAMARPVITTKTPGCEDVVMDGASGFLVAARSLEDLKQRMAAIASMSPEHRSQMGREGRALMEKKYDEEYVVAAYRNALNDIERSRRVT